MEKATIQQLATACALEKTTMSRNVKLLMDMGWIDVLPNERDAREKLLVLNRSGHAMPERVWPAWSGAQAHIERFLQRHFDTPNPAKLIETLGRLQTAHA